MTKDSAFENMNTSDNSILAALLNVVAKVEGLKVGVENQTATTKEVRESLIVIIERLAEQKSQIGTFTALMDRLTQEFKDLAKDVADVKANAQTNDRRLDRVEGVLFGNKETESDGMVTGYKILMKAEDKRLTIWNLIAGGWAIGGGIIVALAVAAFKYIGSHHGIDIPNGG